MRPQHRRGAARGVGRLHDASSFRIKPGIYFADDPAFKGKRRELVAADYVYSIKRHYDPRWKSPQPVPARRRQDARPVASCASEALDDKQPFDYDREVEGLRALDRYTLRSARSAEPSAALRTSDLTDAGADRRAGARGGRVLRRQDHGAPGGHRAFRLARLAAQLAHRARAQPELPRASSTTSEPPADDARAQAMARAAARAGALPMVDRVEVAIIEESAAALAGLPERRARPDRAGAGRVRRPGRPEQQARAQPGQARHQMQRYAACRRRDVATSTWRTRSSAATRPRRWRCAARSRWPTTCDREIRAGAHAARRCRRSRIVGPERLRLRPGASRPR